MPTSHGSTDDGVSGQDVDRVHSLPPSDNDEEDNVSVDRNSEEESSEADATTPAKKEKPAKKKGLFDRIARRFPTVKKKYYSSYVNGVLGVCTRCENYKNQCNCHHCARCDTYMLTPAAKHHCRKCWMPVCKKCCGYERVNNFLTGEKSNTCCDCALPMGLVSLTTNSIFADIASVMAAESNPEKDEPFRANSSFLMPPPLEPFRWGLYLLQGEMSRPRCCVNPSCTHRYSFKTRCVTCQLPTVSTAPTVFPHVDVSAAKAPASGKQSKPSESLGQLTAVESAAYEQRATAVRGMSAHAVDDVFDTYLPSHAESFAFHGLRDQTAAARHVVLALIAAGVANEVGFSPSVSLTFFNNPFTRLLRAVSTNLHYTIMVAPDKTCFVAFPELAKDKQLVRILGNAAMSRREVWNDGTKSRIGVVVHDEMKATDMHLTARATYFDVVDSLWEQTENVDALSDLVSEVLRYAQSGSRIVLCGHSLGGATATIIASRLLIEHTAVLKDKLQCVTFGAPLVADKGLSDLLDKSKLCTNFQHFVMGSDMFPRLHYLNTFLNTGTLSNSTAAARDVTPISANKVKELVLTWYSVQQDGLGLDDTALGRGRDGAAVAASAGAGKVTGVKAWADFFSHFSSDAGSTKATSSKKSGSAAMGSDEDEEASDEDEAARGDDSTDGGASKGSKNTATTTTTAVRETKPLRKATSVEDCMSPLTAAGDIFGRGREPFDNDFVGQSYRKAPRAKPTFEERLQLPKAALNMREESTASFDGGDAQSPLLNGDFLINSTETFRMEQLVEPYGCYNFLWKAQDIYTFSDSPARTIGYLCDQTLMRVHLQDHFMSAYWRGLLEYLHSIPV